MDNCLYKNALNMCHLYSIRAYRDLSFGTSFNYRNFVGGIHYLLGGGVWKEKTKDFASKGQRQL